MARRITECSTIRDHIDYGKQLNFKYENMYLNGVYRYPNLSQNDKKKTGDRVIFPTGIIVQRYGLILDSYIYIKTFTEKEFIPFRQNPRNLSYQLYGTQELWSLLLRINRMQSIMEFTKLTINLYSKDVLPIINEILILESKTKKENRRRLEDL